jgi:pentatricopeptide repeat protein
VLGELAKGPWIWNAFLYAFCLESQFASASQLIKNMTDGKPVGIPQPNVYSWNIFMQAFFKTSQVRPAERIYEIMRSRGIEPDQYTHGVLLRGYAKAQNIEKIGEVMGNIENAQQLDPILLQALTRVQDRKKLMLVLEHAGAAKKEKAKREAEEKARKRKSEMLELEQARLAKEREYREKLDAEKEERRKRLDHHRFASMLPKRRRLTLSDVQK